MKVLLTTLNSKFTHSSLALRYLKMYGKKEGFDFDLMEFTINNSLDYILSEINAGKYDIVVFSCYIWNFEQTIKLIDNIKIISPNCKIIVGGPEVTYNPDGVMAAHPNIDYIISGEGEIPVVQLIKALNQGGDGLDQIRGLTYKVNHEIHSSGYAELVKSLDEIPFPYENLDGLENRILYYESSRGCPFNCQYCLSSTFKGVRYFSLARVKEDLKFFVDRKVKQVKFVDRTFNANKNHALSIMKYLHETDNGYTNFHFEITASLLDDETIAFLQTVRLGLFQFEVGVQSTNEETIQSIERNIAFEKIAEKCRQVQAMRNIHLHMDLIAGLPFEDYKRFMQSIDDVFELRPDKLQMGFLKLLRGSGLRLNAQTYGIEFRNYQPYEVLKTNWMSYDDLSRLKEIEELVESYYNSKNFKYSFEYILAVNGIKPSVFFEDFVDYWLENGLQHVSHKSDLLYQIVYDFYIHQNFVEPEAFLDLLKFDFLRTRRKKTIGLFKEEHPKGFKNLCYDYLKDEEHRAHVSEDYRNLNVKAVLKKVEFEPFGYNIFGMINSGYKQIVKQDNVILFDYNLEHKVFEKSNYFQVEIDKGVL